MNKKRATIIISGDVQDVGFRGIVMRLAQKSGLMGYAENLPDGSVRAICEGEEKSIKVFAKKLEIRNGDVSVEKIDVKWSKAQGKFKYFEVKYSDLGAEMFQGFATAGRMLGDVRNEVKASREDIKSMHTDLKEETKKTHEKLDKMSGKLDKIVDGTVKTHEKLDNIDNRLGDALNRYDVFGQKMISIETEMKEFTKQITRLVDHLVESKTQEK